MWFVNLSAVVLAASNNIVRQIAQEDAISSTDLLLDSLVSILIIAALWIAFRE
jgi:hypothetical protein